MLGKKFRLLTITLLTLLSTLSLRAIETKYTATIEPGQKYLFGCSTYDAAATPSKTLTAFGGGDSIVHLTLKMIQPIAVQFNAVINSGETYLFGCDTYTAEGSYTRTIPRVNGGDSTITVNLSYAAAPVQDIAVQYDAVINAGETYLFGCDTYTAEGSYTRTIPRVNGGDSTITVNLSYAAAPVQNIAVQYDAVINAGETYLFGCDTYTAEGSYTRTIPRVNGGDSTITVNLSYAAQNITVTYDALVMTDEYYLFGCQAYTFADPGPQTLTKTIQRVNGGDSTIIVNLTVAAAGGADPIEVKYEATIKPGQTYLFGCDALTVAGDYINTLKRTNGSDSIINLKLNVLAQDTAVKYTATIKQGQTYLFGCQKLTTAGPYTNTLTRALGGDSIINLTLNVLATTYLDTTIAACDSLVWIHETIKTSGDYIDTIPNVAGGDSIVTLHLTINHPTTGSETITECDVFNWHGKDYTTSGTYVDTLTSLVTGCDSIVTLNLTINHSDVGEETITACDSIEWKGQKYYTSGDYQFDTLTVLGCDSTIILHLTVNYSGVGEETITACDSVMWKGQKYTASGDYQFDTLTVAGCDSIITLHLTINHSDVGEETATACDSYTWKGTTYTASGDYTFDTLTVLGCDSIITLHLTIRQSTVGDTTAVECNSFDWYGTTYTESGDYQHILTNVAGCDSTLTMHLTIHYSDSTIKPTPTEPICHSYYWAEADTTIINSGTYTHVFQNQYGCDSVVTFTIDINMPYVDTLEVRAYYGWRIIMINRNQINTIPGWSLDSLQADHPEYVTWHQIDLNGNDTEVGTGYYYTLASGEPLPTGYQYYAIVSIPAAPDVPCGAFGRTETITIGAAAPAPALVPSLARPGEDIQVINLDPAVETTIRVYSADGILQKTLTSNGDIFCTIKAADAIGFYLVEIISDDMKSTLRYMVK